VQNIVVGTLRPLYAPRTAGEPVPGFQITRPALAIRPILVTARPFGGVSNEGEDRLTKHSRAERSKRAEQREATARIQAAWQASIPAAQAKEFNARVAASIERGPAPRPADMAPGTAPNPPRPGHEPKPKVDKNQQRRRRY